AAAPQPAQPGTTPRAGGDAQLHATCGPTSQQRKNDLIHYPQWANPAAVHSGRAIEVLDGTRNPRAETARAPRRAPAPPENEHRTSPPPHPQKRLRPSRSATLRHAMCPSPTGTTPTCSVLAAGGSPNPSVRQQGTRCESGTAPQR